MKDYLVTAIQSLRPDSAFVITNDDYSTIVWNTLEGKAPTAKEVDAEIERLKAKEIEDAANNATAKAALLARLGITEEEARLLLA
jgi:hypothetical protein